MSKRTDDSKDHDPDQKSMAIAAIRRCISPSDEQALSNPGLGDFDRQIEVQCGSLMGKLWMDRFICPGIHQQCIEFNGTMITPKEFCIQANKDRQKDWKGSIRIGKSNLRVLMEMKTIDFHQHDTFCSAKCQSRNYMALSKSEIFTSDDFHEITTSTSSSPSSTYQKLVSQTFTARNNRHVAFTGQQLKKEEATPGILELNDNDNHQHQHQQRRHHETINNMASVNSHANIITLMTNQPVQFWEQMHSLGIISELIDDILRTIEQMRAIYPLASDREECSVKLSAIAKLLNLGDTFCQRIHTKRLETVFESTLLNNELKELQRKAEEQKRRQEETKRKTQPVLLISSFS